MSKIEYYFNLNMKEQAEILHGLAPVIGRRAEILEKDIWLCQFLKLIFELPDTKPIAFKGGTSLSKVYQAIDRFSEDIDITIDYQSLSPGVPSLESLSNSQIKKLDSALRESLNQYITQSLLPSFLTRLEQEMPQLEIKTKLSEDSEKLWVFYPSAVENKDIYLPSSILIEFGGRNSTLPNNLVSITPDIATHIPALLFPSANVSVLSPQRTFWEKATLIHVECHRPNIRIGADRLSRHWYDLARLVDHEIGKLSLNNMEILKDVLRIKGAFFRSSYSHYDLCLSGGFKLIPSGELLESLRKDYKAMLDAQMFYGNLMSFDDIIDRLYLVENKINNTGL